MRTSNASTLVFDATEPAKLASMKNDAFLQRAGRIAGIGGWRVGLNSRTVEWSDQTCRILGAPLGFRPTLAYATRMYTAASQPMRLSASPTWTR